MVTRALQWLRASVPVRWFPAGVGVVGVGYLALVSVLASFGQPIVDANEPVLGGAGGAIADLVAQRYGDEVTRIYATLAAATLLVGSLLGVGAGVIVAMRAKVRGDRTRPRHRILLGALLLVAFMHVAVLAWSMVSHPQEYVSSFYDRGGLRRSFQVLVCDHLSPNAIALSTGIVLTLAALGDPRRWPTALERLRATLTMRRALVMVGLGVVVTLLVWTPHLATGAAVDASRPNILVLAADAVRTDRMRPDLMPNVTALAARGTQFDRDYVTVPPTGSSWTTILTGRHAHHHGIRSTFASWDERTKLLDALPERFAAAGYRTAVVSDFAGDIFGHVAFGFQVIDAARTDFRQLLRDHGLERDVMLLPFLDTAFGRRVLPSLKASNTSTDPMAVAGDVMRELHAMKGSPFVLTTFFSTTHFPYAAPYPFYRRFTDPAYAGVAKYGRTVGFSQNQEANPTDVKQVRALYDGAVASVDAAIGSILDDLRREGLDRNTIVVFTADHGENLYETHFMGSTPGAQGAGIFGHGESLFGDEALHVPLIIYDPRKAAAARTSTVVSSVDIAPTIYDLAHVTPPTDLDGRSLAPAMDGRPLAPAPVFAETELWFTDPSLMEDLRVPTPPPQRMLTIDEAHGDQIAVRSDVVDLTLVARHRMVRDERWKLVYMPTRAGAAYSLFDTENDPRELVDLMTREPAEGERLMKVLWTWMLQDPRAKEDHNYLVPKEPWHQ